MNILIDIIFPAFAVGVLTGLLYAIFIYILLIREQKRRR